MPVGSPSPSPGYGPSSCSASAIVAGAVSGHCVLDIVNYSRVKEERIDSGPFRAGGRTWFVEYHPNGRTSEDTGYISLFLALDDVVTEAVNAQVKISLLDQYGKPVPSYSRITEVVNFSDKGSWGFPKFIEREVLEKSKYLRNDCFTVRFDVTIMKDIHTEETPVIVVPPSDMHRHFGDILSSEEGADVKFQVGNKAFSAHRLVLAARSPVFKTELYGLMQESTAVIPIDDMEAEVFSALLTFLYTDTIPEMKEQEESAMTRHLLVAAVKYRLERLKLICEDRLCKQISMDSIANILALAEQHNCRGLKEACMEFSRSSESALSTRSHPAVLKELMSVVAPCCPWRRKSKAKA
ncbi:hypothetical protein PR202_gb08043 [Eleusine coracana subsp. coracana]|uniref:Uncharacterized protein n=1 Tax=Eleusine coracana subsp. coracana TaxID=191504 RepID=A0AAV5ED36_ELECO|nr:hypothetical protein QOZ80_2BG0180370 [Eleusine coracana subsp. coracana]GJN20643.1 hypothetical protein PR202_gb08043 [Eleusine coracana subsp. coracana]